MPKSAQFLAWSKLKREIQGKDVISRAELKKMFYTAKLQSIEDDPDVWVSSLERIQMRLNRDFQANISEKDLMLQAFNNLLKACESLMDILVQGLAKGELKTAES